MLLTLERNNFMTTKKPATTKPAAKKDKPATKPAAKAVVAKKEKVAKVEEVVTADKVVATAPIVGKPTLEKGRYIFATGRRKTAIANIRLFGGKGEIVVNKKPFDTYFFHGLYRDSIMKPLELTGLAHDFYFTATVNGGGVLAQAQATQHGVSQALASMGEDIRKILKKNGFLTRDDRKKERKKPGLRGARRAPQWAKR